jgi:hypothetical protein
LLRRVLVLYRLEGVDFTGIALDAANYLLFV